MNKYETVLRKNKINAYPTQTCNNESFWCNIDAD